MIDAAARNLVRIRADNRCEYCLLRQEYSDDIHHVEHIVAKQHGGSDDPGNLALACHRCNLSTLLWATDTCKYLIEIQGRILTFKIHDFNLNEKI